MKLAFDVIGAPAPQGSKRFVGLSRAGRGIMIESCKAVKPWRMDVASFALKAMLDQRMQLFTGAVRVTITFRLRRPKGLPLKVKYHTKKPDADKLTRSTFDAMTVAGVWNDDSQVVSQRIDKRYACPGETTGALIMVEDMT